MQDQQSWSTIQRESGALDDTRETSPLRKLGKVFFQDPCWLFIPICVLYFAPAVRQCLKMKYVLQRLQKLFPSYTILSRSLSIPQLSLKLNTFEQWLSWKKWCQIIEVELTINLNIIMFSSFSLSKHNLFSAVCFTAELSWYEY